MSKVYKFLLILCLGTFLVGCSKITQENFDKVKPGMPFKEVTAILGQPTSVDSTNFAGMSGITAKWKNMNAEIIILFFNDRVQYKSFSKPTS